MGIRRGACAVHLVLIAVLSLAPARLFPPSPPGIPGMDKWMHGVLYGVLGALLRWAAEPGAARRAAGWWPVAGAVYGFAMELLQPWIGGEGRAFSWGDAAANLAGVVIFWTAFGWILRRGKTSF